MCNSLTLMSPSSLPPSPPLSLLGGINNKSNYKDVFSSTNTNWTCFQILPFFSSPSFSSSFFTRFTFLWLAAFLRPPPCPSASSSESENSSSQAILLSWARTKTGETKFIYVPLTANRLELSVHLPILPKFMLHVRLKLYKSLTGDAFVRVLLILISAVRAGSVLRNRLHLDTRCMRQHTQILEQALLYLL